MESSSYKTPSFNLPDLINSGFYESLREGVIIFDAQTREPIYFNKVITQYTGWELNKFDLEAVNQFLPESQADGIPSINMFDEVFKNTLKNGSYTRDILLDLKYRMLYVNVNSHYIRNSNIVLMLLDDTKIPLDSGPFELSDYHNFKYRRLNESRLGSYDYCIESRDFTFSQLAREILNLGNNETMSWDQLKVRIPNYQVENIEKNINNAIQKNSSFEVMHQILDGDGEKWVLNWGRTEQVESGRVKKLKGVFQDITQRITEERTLRFNEAIEKTIRTLLSEIIIHDDEDKLYTALINKMSTLLNFEDCVIYTWDDRVKKLIQRVKFKEGLIHIDKPDQAEAPEVLDLGEGIVGSVAKKKKPEIVQNLRNDPRYIKDEKLMGSEMAVPIIVEGKLIGVLDTEHREAGFYNKYHLKVLETIASILGVKVVQVRSQNEIWRQKQMLQGSIDSFKDAAVYTIDKDWRLIAFNATHKTFCHLQGIKDVSMGMKIEEFTQNKRWLVHLRGHFRSLFSGETSFVSFVEKLAPPNREPLKIQISIGPLKSTTGEVFALTVLYQDITERERHLEAFKKSEEREKEMKRLLRIRKAENALQFYKGREDERQRIAMTLHDEVANGVAALILMLDNVRQRDGNIQQEWLTRFADELKELYEKTRQVSHDLVNTSLDYSDFCNELKELIISNLGRKIQMNFFISDQEKVEGLNKHLKNELLLIFSELSLNMARHAYAKNVNVSLLVEEDIFSAVVEDDGVGFEKSKVANGLGLKNINHRVKLLGGVFNVDSTPGRGTIALLEIPLDLNLKD